MGAHRAKPIVSSALVIIAGCLTSCERELNRGTAAGSSVASTPPRPPPDAGGRKACIPHAVRIAWPEEWFVKKITDHECHSYWLWREAVRSKPDVVLQLCAPETPSWSRDAGANPMDQMLPERHRMSYQDRDLELRLLEQPDGTLFGDARVTYWPVEGAAEQALLEFHHLKSDDLATLVTSLLAADLVAKPERRGSTPDRAYVAQCHRERLTIDTRLDELSVEAVAAQIRNAPKRVGDQGKKPASSP